MRKSLAACGLLLASAFASHLADRVALSVRGLEGIIQGSPPRLHVHKERGLRSWVPVYRAERWIL